MGPLCVGWAGPEKRILKFATGEERTVLNK